ncbi:ABC transporter ATP-binding protein [Candidatus Pelagibacter sp.]|jgi:ATP-binding cassette, subfamily B, bacterial PglK|nr:ABC transporter ATP-binding protein [Candidatus Pelagibacter sp.]
MFTENINYINKILDKKERFYLIAYFFFSIIVGLLETIGIGIIPGFFSVLIDKNILINKFDFGVGTQSFIINFFNSENLILYLCFGTIGFFLIKSSILFLFNFFDAKLTRDLKISISSKLFRIYINKDYLFHSTNNPIILGRNISSEVNISVAHIKSFLIIIKEVIQLILIFFLLLFANLNITLSIFGIFLILSLIYLKIFGKKLKQKSEVAFHERGFKSKIINQILNAIIEVKIYKKENFIINKFIESIKKEFQSKMFLEIISKIPKIFIETFIVSLVCTIIFFSVKIGYNVEALIAFVALYFFAALRAYPSINSVLMQNMALIQGKISINKLSKEFEKSNLDQNFDNLITEKEFDFQNLIELKNVFFKYPDRNSILKKINIKIFKNTILGIKGATGSGKSTFIKLVMNLLEPSSGVIEIDKIPMKTVKNSWQGKISYIPQNFYILDDTLLENIVFSEEEKKLDLNKIDEILKFCELDIFVKELPKGLSTIVGPSGKLLSGGQAQRLAIARALYQDRDLLIFDEATSALDEDTEKRILKNILNLKKTKTIIIISHNQNVLEQCDQIIEFKENKII